MPDPNNYTVGWICAGFVEYLTAQSVLDEHHEDPGFKEHSDIYTLGRVGEHNVVLALQQPSTATRVAENLVREFTNVRVYLFVSIGGGAPSQRHDVRLGDVVVGFAGYNTGSVLQYDYRKTILKNKLVTRGVLQPPSMPIQEAIEELRTKYRNKSFKLQDTITTFFKNNPDLKLPNPDTDKLYVSSFTYNRGDKSGLIPRSPRFKNERAPAVHNGFIASGDRTIQDAEIRDQLAFKKHILCFETGASRLLNCFPYLVICGICNYCDTYKGTEWETYAAIAAAAHAKALLGATAPSRVEAGSKLSKILSDVQGDEERTRNWLSPSNPSVNLNRALRHRHPGTGAWFLQHPRYLDWKLTTNSLLWLTGIPGCGKTILASSVIKDLKKTHSNNLVYFYFDIRDPYQRNHNDMLRSLVMQLYRKETEARGHLDSLYSACEDGQKHPTLESLRIAFQKMVQQIGEVWIILDALDECITDSEGQVEELFLLEIKELRRMHGDVHILVTSRQEPYIKSTVKSFINTQSIFRIYSNLIRKDIGAYVYSRTLSARNWNINEQSKIENLLVKRADGMFRWVSSQLDALEISSKARSIEETLASLPKALEETYTRILTNVTLQRRHHTRILQFLVYSERSLRIAEIVDALATVPTISRSNPYARFTKLEDILRCYPGFVVITNWRDDESQLEIGLAHHSIRDFLMSPKNEIPPQLRETTARASIVEVCLTYLLHLEPGLPIQELRRTYPMAQYAAQYWMVHASKSEHAVQGSILRFFKSQESFCTCYRLYSPDRPWRKDNEYYKPPPVLYYASLTGLFICVQRLLIEGADLGAQGGLYGNALQAASYKGHINVANLLVDYGADINAEGGKFGNALQAAVTKRHANIVRMLLAHGVHINAQGGKYGNALHAAVCKGYTDIVRMLLAYGADPNTQSGIYANSLQAASSKGYAEIVKTLVEHGVDINSQGQSALYAASYAGHIEIVKMLLGYRVKTDSQTQPALYVASYEGHADIVTVLLEYGVDTNSQGQSSLHAASYKGHTEIVRTLLKHGINTISQRQHALHVALHEGHAEIVRILLKYRVDTNSQVQCTPFATVRAEHKNIDDVSQERRADLNVTGEEHDNAMQSPSSKGYKNSDRIPSNGVIDESAADRELHSPRTIKDALEAGNIEVLHGLIADQFDQVTVGEYFWLKELKEFGYSSNEIADLVFEQYNDSPWIFFEPMPHVEANARPDFHLTNCSHHVLDHTLNHNSSSPSLAVGSHTAINDEDIMRLVHESCGIAGVSPQSREQQSWTGFVEFHANNAALVSYGSKENGEQYHQPLLTRICEALSRLCTAVSRVQDSGLCCNCFTIAVRPETTVDPSIQLRRLPLRLASDLLSILQEGMADENKVDRLMYKAASYASEIVNFVVPTTFSGVEGDTETFLHRCSLATQLLCVGFVSYAQAHVGPIQLSFLDVELKKIYLLGSRGFPTDCISVELVSLTCIGEMIHDQAITFGLLQPAEEQAEVTEQKFSVSTNIGDLLDTWGPGKLIVRKDDPTHVSAIRLGSGMIWCSDTEKCIFHWSQVPPSEPPEPIRISPDTQLVIGSLVTWNKGCKTEIEQCWTRNVHHLEQLGTHKPYWEDAEWQVGLQAGQYAIVQVNHTWSKIHGQSLKQCRLQQDDKTLVFFLEEPWGLQISYCTGVARRVPLREVVADLLDIFLSIYNTTKMDREIWEELRKLGIIEALRRPNFNEFLSQLESRFNPDTKVEEAIIQMIRTILRALEPTGIHQGKLIVACFWGQEIFRCFKIPCQNDHAWANVLADSEDCATFAYMSTRCLETKKIACPRTNNAWKNRVLLMQTSIVLCSAPEPLSQSLQDKQIYFFDKFEREIFVLARKPEQAIVAELTMTSFRDTPRTFILRLKAKDGRNKHRGRIREMQKVEESGEPVFVL
ncbi:uncharacterized protein F4807DRAFT_361418 [Annulohypoxylon truncatum]|uniref:uncharacterized protein n=1 Tax=Annulohypoxylon truncatum TaxID=327061 RepID=UPI0020089575|nr:uncharacterized protein F4807DRAFT_361418 [Annulohypoxylon truncatum]KAI1212174.1 hypothetical protein F4807DRAFT_361418 [Annulohypoxylon truncatum]